MGTTSVCKTTVHTSTTTMNPIGLLVSLAAVASAGVVPLAVPASVAVRAPAHDSAIIQSHRLGGNFAYRTDEAHAYAVQTPIIGQRTVPVGVSHYQGTPIVRHSTDFVTAHVPQQAVVAVQGQPITQYAAGYPYPYTFGSAIIPSGGVVSAGAVPAAVEVKTA